MSSRGKGRPRDPDGDNTRIARVVHTLRQRGYANDAIHAAVAARVSCDLNRGVLGGRRRMTAYRVRQIYDSFLQSTYDGTQARLKPTAFTKSSRRARSASRQVTLASALESAWSDSPSNDGTDDAPLPELEPTAKVMRLENDLAAAEAKAGIKYKRNRLPDVSDPRVAAATQAVADAKFNFPRRRSKRPR